MRANENAMLPEVSFDYLPKIVVSVDGDANTPTLPNFKVAGDKTDVTDKTYFSTISNEEFIKCIFGEVLGTDRPIVVSFAGNPNTVGQHSWFGKPWVSGKTLLTYNYNNYVSFAAFRPDNEGKYRRQKKYFSGLFAVMLDDIGVKVEWDRITLEPNWKLETSPGNFQIGFILNEPITDPVKADNLLNSIINAGLCDPGSNGACARIGRLPIAINGKYSFVGNTPWRCRLRAWNPERRYSVQEIIDGLQIELKDYYRQKSSQSHKNTGQADPYQNDIHIPRSAENPIITALKESGRYKQPLGDGKHDITCPWVHEHTDQVNHGTAYFAPNGSYPLGGFKCQHGHCSDRRVSDLVDFFSISRVEAKHKPIIRIQAGEIPSICDAAENEMAKTLKYFQRSSMIVMITTDPGTKQTIVKPLSLANLTHVLAGVAIWQSYDKRGNVWNICDPSERHVRILHDSATYSHLPVLNGITRQPYIRADGSLMMNAGYDAPTGMFGVFSAREYNVVTMPTKQQAQQALAELSELVDEFAFKTDNDRSAAISAILTAVIRPALSLAPMIHVKAPTIASGKSYLCELLTTFATPQQRNPLSFPTDDEECRKLLLAELLKSPAVLEFDNLTSDLLPHKSLCTALTSEYISGRILGQSKTVEVSTRALFLSSGNNVDPVRDMTRRTVTITLDPACETPAARNFTKQPVSEVRADRGRFVSLALTIVRAYICAGKPKTECKTIATYSDWSDYCRQPLLWLGIADPAVCIFESMNDDPDRELLGEFLQLWFDQFGHSPTSVKELISLFTSSEELREIIGDIAGERDGSVNRRRLGWWIKRHARQVVNGLRLVQDTATSNAAKWKIESV